MAVIHVGDACPDQESDEAEMINQLKEKFSIAGRSEKIQILTVLPKSWSGAKSKATSAWPKAFLREWQDK